MSTDHTFAAAVLPHRPGLHRHCARLLRSHADAEDALQETLLRAWRSRGGSDLSRPWLYRIATNVCFDLLARRGGTLVSLDEGPLQVAAPPAVELGLVTAIQELPSLQRASFVTREVLGWSAAESATALATSVPAVNSALQRARRRLRRQLREHQRRCPRGSDDEPPGRLRGPDMVLR